MRRWLAVAIPLATAALATLGLMRVTAAQALSLTATAAPSSVPAGGELLYTIAVTNSGDQGVEGLVVSDTLPAAFAYVPGSTALTLNGTRLPAQEPAIVGRNLTWHRLSLPAARPGSVFGMHTFVQDLCNDGYVDYQLDQVRQVAGAGAYVKQLLYGITAQTAGPLPCWAHFVSAAYDRGLIPVVRLEGRHVGAYWEKPQADADGRYTAIAEAFRRVVAGLPRRDGSLLYVEVWNEPNLRLEWSDTTSPAQYGRFLVDVATAIRSLGDPRIVILNGALAPGGDYDNLAFVDALASVPGALQAFDVWASHPYPGNHPPEYNILDGTAAYNRMTIDSYRLELERLAEHGRSGLRVLLTETGYALGDEQFAFEGFPRIDEQYRAGYISRALRDYWSHWPEVLGVCPFELVDPYGHWPVWDWLYPDGRHHAQFDAVAALPKPQGAPSVLTLSFRARAWAEPGTYPSDVSAIAGGVTLAAGRGLAPVTVQPGSPPPTPPAPPPTDPAARELLRNNGFEGDVEWTFLVQNRGGYTTAQAHTGGRSSWLGLSPESPNAYAFSSVEQEAVPPACPGRSLLSFWYRPVSGDSAGDRFKVLARDAKGAFRTLGYLDLNVQGWTYAAFDTTGCDAQAVRLTTVNDGFGGETTVYVDDVHWALSELEHALHLPLALKDPAAAAPLALSRATATPRPAAGLEVRTLSQPAGAGGLRAVALDPESGLAYAAAGDGVWCFDPDGRQPARRLRQGGGARALLVDPGRRCLWVSDWDEGAVLALDLQDGRELARAPHLLRPSGLAAYGDRLFVAETEAAQVVVLDRRTCGIIKAEPVGAAPFALALDPERGRLWVANAGGRHVTVLDLPSGTPVGAVLLEGLGHPQGMAVDSQRGRVYVTYLLGSRYHALAVIDAEQLHLERVLRGNDERPLLGAYGLAVEPGSGRVLLSDVDGLLAVDPATLNAETLLAGHGFVPVFGLAVDPARRRAIVTDGGSSAAHVLAWP